MTQILFNSKEDINNEWLFYIENEAKSLAQRDEYAIHNYLDREIFNPDMKNYLISDDAATLLNEVNETETLSLNLREGMKANFLPDLLRPRFRKLKTKVKKIFCEVVTEIGELDTKGIIRTVLVALIPAFATGIPAVVLPILIGLIAYLIKFGVEKACPA